jgi:hypothetical protein
MIIIKEVNMNLGIIRYIGKVIDNILDMVWVQVVY